MENVIFIIKENLNEVIEYAIIDRGNGEFTSMTKAHWDELQAKQSEGGLK